MSDLKILVTAGPDHVISEVYFVCKQDVSAKAWLAGSGQTLSKKKERERNDKCFESRDLRKG